MANVAPPGLATFTYPTSVLVNGVPTIVQLPAAGYRLFTYDAGTTNPRTTWSNAGETVANANPIILDANGQAQIFYRGNYKLELRQPVALGGAVIWTVDNFNVPDPSASTSIQFANGTAAAPSIRFAQATSSGLYSPAANQVAMSISGVQAMLWAAGNVGIGGTPTQKLDVFGTTRLQGTTTITTGGLTVTAGGATVTAGGLTVAAGGATITGNSTVSGTFGVTGNTTISGGTFASRGFADNATTASWQIDSTGRLRNPANTQVSFSATLTTNQTTPGVFIFNSTGFAGGHNTGGGYSTSTGIFTAPVDGDYLICAVAYIYNSAGTSVSNWTAELRINGSAVLSYTLSTDRLDQHPVVFNHIARLTSGQTVSISSASLSASMYLIPNSTFSIRQVG